MINDEKCHASPTFNLKNFQLHIPIYAYCRIGYTKHMYLGIINESGDYYTRTAARYFTYNLVISFVFVTAYL